MGCGSWDTKSFVNYSTSKGVKISLDGAIVGDYSNQDMFKSTTIDVSLNPKNVIRECCDTEEHPNTIPVILALDVTGSMGSVAVEVAKKLNTLMTGLYKNVADIEFMIMGIGDLSYDNYPIQASQFESDIRIAEQLDKIYFEFGGGGNNYESYTSAWYFGSRHTKLDCLKRGRKGIIITMGDEMLNPYLPFKPLSNCTGDNLQSDIETKDLYNEVCEKYNIYHLNVEHRSYFRSVDDNIESSFKEYLDDEHFKNVTLDNLVDEITNIIINESKNNVNNVSKNASAISSDEEITW